MAAAPDLDETLREEIMASTIRKRLEEGDHSFLDASSPATKSMIQNYNLIQGHCASEDKPRLVKRLATGYINRKSSMQAMQDEAPKQNTSKLLTTSSVTPLSTAVPEDPVPKKRVLVWGNNDKIQFSNLAHAKDAIGPTFAVLRTTAHVAGCDTTWKNSVLKCQIKDCPVMCVLSSPTTTLDSSPAFVEQKQKHNHKEVSWLEHYRKPLKSMKMGVPPLVDLFLEETLKQNIDWQPRQALIQCQKRFGNDPLFMDREVREKLNRKITDRIRVLKGKYSNKLSEFRVERVEYEQDLRAFIQDRRVKYELLENIGWKPISGLTDTELLENAKILKRSSIFKGTVKNGSEPHKELFVLMDESVLSHPKLVALSRTQGWKRVEDKNIVFSSLALLSNFAHCKRLGWKVCCSSDGTHNITNNDYKLIVYGCYGWRKNGKRTFYPFGYCMGEGEREYVVLYTFLNLHLAAEKMFGIDNVMFLGGCISDHSNVFTNTYKNVLSKPRLLQCYPHIIRKFLMDDQRKGNGSYYSKHCKTKDLEWFKTTALVDVKALHRCKTHSQFMSYWQDARQSWEVKGEKGMAETFESSYIMAEDFSNWRYNSSGLVGCHPDNNPTERNNLSIKGTVNSTGIMVTGRSMRALFNVELNKMVWFDSTNNVGPRGVFPVLDKERAMTNENFLLFIQNIRKEDDIRSYTQEGLNGFLMNDITFLGHAITREDITRYTMALAGGYHPTEGRAAIVQVTQRFHFLSPKPHPYKEGETMYVCDCEGYYKTLWCQNACWFNNRDWLIQATRRINGATSKKKKRSKHLIEKDILAKVLQRVKENDRRKQEQSANVITQTEED